MSKEIIVAGGGASGMMVAAAAAECGCSVLLLERNEKLGKKLYITGKGRCNITNACETQDLFKQVLRNPKFLYSAFYTYDNFRVMDFFEKQKVPLKTERGGRVFPVSDHSSDVIRGLEGAMRRLGVKVLLNTRIVSIERIRKTETNDINNSIDAGGIIDAGNAGQTESAGQTAWRFCVKDASGSRYMADRVILATGGLSYPATGSSGDGYTFARAFGHKIEQQYPALVALKTQEPYIPKLQGLSLKNVRAVIADGRKVLYDDFGEMMFTHFGVSGPLMLRASSIISSQLQKKPLPLRIDLKPALDRQQLDRRILRDFEENLNKNFKNALNRLLPSKLIPVVTELSGISPEKKINEVTKEERAVLLDLIKDFPATITGLRDFNEAVITRGGVNVREVNPSTMESKMIPGLYFAGELLDVDALTGGYNLQIAWSTGYLAGRSAAASE